VQACFIRVHQRAVTRLHSASNGWLNNISGISPTVGIAEQLVATIWWAKTRD